MSNKQLTRSVSVIGVGMTNYGDSATTPGLTGMSLQDMATWAVADALEDAGVNPRDVGKLVLGMVCSPFYNSDCIAPCHGLSEFVGMKGSSAVYHNEACATAHNCFNEAVASVASGICDIAVCVDADSVRYTNHPIMPSSYRFPSNEYEELYGRSWAGGDTGGDTAYTRWLGSHYAQMDGPPRQYMRENGITAEELDDALIGFAITGRQHAALNPKSFLRTPWEEVAKGRNMEAKEYLKSKYNPKYTEYVRPSFSGAMTEGAAAIVVCATDIAHKYRQMPIEVVGIANVVIGTQQPNIECVVANEVGKKIYEITGMKPEDIEYLQTSDMDLADALYSAESVGYLPKGEGWKYVRDGLTRFDSKKPMNTDGGHVNYGHAFAATQMATFVEPILQMRGQAGERQIPKPPKIAMARIQGALQSTAAFIFKTVEGVANEQQPAASRYEPKPLVKMFYDGLDEGKFLGMKCAKCGNIEFPLYAACNQCGDIGNNEIVELSGEVTVNEVYTILPAYTPPHMAPYAPIFAAGVKLAEGPERACLIFGITTETYPQYRDNGPFKAKLVVMPSAQGLDYNSFAVSLDGVAPIPKADVGMQESEEMKLLKSGKMNEYGEGEDVLTVDSTIGALLANPKVEAFFSENLSEVTNHPNLAAFKGMPFSTIASMPQAGIDPDRVDKLEEFLKTL